MLIAARHTLGNESFKPVDGMWIGSNSKQYFDCLEMGSSELSFELAFAIENSFSTTGVENIGCGRWDAPPNKRYHISIDSARTSFSAGVDYVSQYFQYVKQKKHLMSFDAEQKVVLFDGKTQQINFDRFTTEPYTFYMFSRNTSSGVGKVLPLRMYYMRMYRNGIKVREWVPRMKDGLCLPYDMVSKNFAVGLGTGDFSYGYD